MKKITVMLLVALSLTCSAVAADKPLGVEEYTSVEELAFSLGSYFPKAQGDVKTVQGERVTLSLTKKDMIMPGMELTLWREGKEILHPVTKAVIGRVEDEVGTVEIVSVNDSSSSAVLKKKLKDPAPGDKARITPRKINAALVPLTPEHPEIVRTLTQRLNEFGRINVLDQGKTDTFIKNSKTKGTRVVKELGTAFGLDAVIAIGVYPTEGKLMVTARIFYTEDASQLDTIVALLDMKSNKQAIGEIKPFFTPQQKEEKTASPELPFLSQFFVAGDFEGDGRLEYAFSDGTRVHIYRNEPSGWREVWTEVLSSQPPTNLEWQGQMMVAQNATVQHINLDSADINGNGKPELFVTEMVNGQVLSYVLEFQDGSFRRVAEVPGFLRVVTYPGKGTILIGQAYDPGTFYAGQPRQVTWSQGKYVAGEEITLPRDLPIYGWTFANFGESSPLLVALDDEDRLDVFSGGTLVWKSAEQYPVVATYVNKPATGVQAVLNKQTTTDKGQRVRLPGRLFAVDVNGDGRDEVIVPKNLSSGLLGGFTGAELDGLRWTGARLDPAWSVKDVPGPIIDVRCVQFPSGFRLNALVKTQGGIFSKDRQQVMMYPLQ